MDAVARHLRRMATLTVASALLSLGVGAAPVSADQMDPDTPVSMSSTGQVENGSAPAAQVP